MLRVYSVFSSLQGESSFQGLSCGFVRLAGCPLNCTYCDTRYACESSGEEMTISQILSSLSKFSVSLVEVTGGEPLIQSSTPQLLSSLCDVYKAVLLETSGAMIVKEVDPRVRVILDVKCPDSGMSDRMVLNNLEILSKRPHELKFVLSSRRDFDWAVDFCNGHSLWDRELLFSPVQGELKPSELADWIVESGRTMRFHFQLHKIIWPDSKGER